MCGARRRGTPWPLGGVRAVYAGPGSVDSSSAFPGAGRVDGVVGEVRRGFGGVAGRGGGARAYRRSAGSAPAFPRRMPGAAAAQDRFDDVILILGGRGDGREHLHLVAAEGAEAGSSSHVRQMSLAHRCRRFCEARCRPPGLVLLRTPELYLPGLHEAIIDQRTWDQVHKVMEKQDRESRHRWTEPYLLKRSSARAMVSR